MDSSAPVRSGASAAGFLESGISHSAQAAPAAAIGTLIRNTDPHQKWASSRPPTIGPSAMPTPLVPAQTPMAREVRGFGRQYGQLAAEAGPPRVALLPKIRLDIVALDDDVETLVEAIVKHARTETIGDGKIWITPVDGAVRVRTGEGDRAAI